MEFCELVGSVIVNSGKVFVYWAKGWDRIARTRWATRSASEFCGFSFCYKTFYDYLYFEKRFFIIDRSSHRRCSVKKLFLEILQNSQKNTCARVSFLIKLQPSGLKFSRTLFLTEHLRWLLLKLSLNMWNMNVISTIGHLKRAFFEFFGKYTQVNPYIDIFVIKVKITKTKRKCPAPFECCKCLCGFWNNRRRLDLISSVKT